MLCRMSVLGNLRATAADIARGMRKDDWRRAILLELKSLPHAATTAIPWLLRARADADESLIKVVIENARLAPGSLAVEMHDVRWTWSDLDGQSSRVAHVLAKEGVKKGDVVAVVGENSPRYLALLLGVARLGGTSALINHHLGGAPLAHAVRTSGARVAIVEAQFRDSLVARTELSEQLRTLLTYGPGDLESRLADAPARPYPRMAVPTTDDFVYIYTSGTTGLPKPCKVSHARAVVAGASFGNVLFGFQPGDKLYSVLPLYHSSALLLGFGSSVMTRTPLALRERFSATHFWSDVQRYRATAIVYIGELCRYLINTAPCEAERNNPVRIALGNGLRADVWPEFQRRFQIASIREFYGATEAPGAIFNLHDRVGSIGRVPLRRLGRLKLARYDVERDELIRDANGRCVECQAGEVGHLLIKLDDEPASALSDFRGYTDEAATQKKMLRDVFERGDRFFLSGDLMRFDEDDFFYFVDRIGDTYRWKGENVSTAEVAEVLARAPGVLEATVTGVLVPGMEGQAGLAAIVVGSELDRAAFWRAAQELPAYAQPRFVRVLSQLATTGTFKVQKTELRHAGVDPARVADPLYFRTDDGYAPLDADVWHRLVQGQVRL